MFSLTIHGQWACSRMHQFFCVEQRKSTLFALDRQLFYCCCSGFDVSGSNIFDEGVWPHWISKRFPVAKVDSNQRHQLRLSNCRRVNGTAYCMHMAPLAPGEILCDREEPSTMSAKNTSRALLLRTVRCRAASPGCSFFSCTHLKYCHIKYFASPAAGPVIPLRHRERRNKNWTPRTLTFLRKREASRA